MATGIVVPALFSIVTSTSEEILIKSFNPPYKVSINGGPWTPPQYSKPALTVLTIPATVDPSTGGISSPSTNYVFDAVFRILHNRRITKTQHPVLTGANITDHAFVQPARLSLEIGMSDAMTSFEEDIWVGAATKSVSAWQIMKNLAAARTLFNVTTRLDSYINMLIVDMSSPDDNRTKHALRATFVLEELISASVSSVQTSSSRPQTSGNTSNGIIQSVAPSASQIQQNVIPSTQFPDVITYPQIPGAGNVSSNSLGQLP